MASLSAPTLDDLITDVRNMLNQPDPNNSFWTDQELSSYLNEACRRYFTDVIMNMEGQFEVQADLDIVDGVETVALPADCFKIKAVYRKVSNGYEILPYQNNLTSGYQTNGNLVGDFYLPAYQFRQNNLVLRPAPSGSEVAALRVLYVQLPETLVNGGDSLTGNISPVFKDLIQMYAVYKAKMKESLVNNVQVYGVAQESVNSLYKSFQDAIRQRSAYPQFTTPFSP